MNRFLSGRPSKERTRISALADQVVDFLHHWAADHPIVDPVRFPAIALAMAAAAPWMSLGELCDMATIPSWIYALDEAFDRRAFVLGGPEELTDLVARVSAGSGGGASDPWSALLADVCERLARRPQWPALRDDWARTCALLARGMAFECRAGAAIAAGGPPPAMTAYIRRAAFSIGVPSYLVGAWVIAGEPEALEHLPELRRLATSCGIAVRLANDLRTYAQDAREGNCNALMLLGCVEGAAPPEARLRRWAERRAARADAACVRLRIQAAELARRVTRFAVDFYASRDFHELGRASIPDA